MLHLQEQYVSNYNSTETGVIPQTDSDVWYTKFWRVLEGFFYYLGLGK